MSCVCQLLNKRIYDDDDDDSPDIGKRLSSALRHNTHTYVSIQVDHVPLQEQHCTEPPPSALNTTLPAFAAERRLQTHQPLINARAQQQTRRPPLPLSIDGTDGRTDGLPTVTQTLILIRNSRFGATRGLAKVGFLDFTF